MQLLSVHSCLRQRHIIIMPIKGTLFCLAQMKSTCSSFQLLCVSIWVFSVNAGSHLCFWIPHYSVLKVVENCILSLQLRRNIPPAPIQFIYWFELTTAKWEMLAVFFFLLLSIPIRQPTSVCWTCCCTLGAAPGGRGWGRGQGKEGFQVSGPSCILDSNEVGADVLSSGRPFQSDFFHCFIA